MHKFRARILILLTIAAISFGFSVSASQTSFLNPNHNFGDFIDPANAYLDDGSYAIVRSGQDHRYWGFNFDNSELPSGSTIEGIEVNIRAKTFNPSVGRAKLGIELSWDDGQNWTSTDNGVNITGTSENSYSAGGSSYDWGRTWSTSELKTPNSNFRIKLDNKTGPGRKKVIKLDLVSVKIYYSSGTTIVAPDDITLAVDRGKTTETDSLNLSYFGNSSGEGQITVSGAIGLGNVVPGTVLRVKGGNLGSYRDLISGANPQGPLVLKNGLSVSGSVSDIKLQLDATDVSPGAPNLGQSWEYVLTYTISSS